MPRKVLRSLIIAAVLLSPTASPASEDIDRHTAEARAMVKAFAARLQGELKSALKTVGPEGAIGVCNIVAPEIANDASKRSGWRVARTALRLRNPANAPDDWERRVLEEFVRRQQAGESAATLEHREVIEKDGKRVFRYMKAIGTKGVCLTCHGAQLAPGLSAEIRQLYPDDKATGFRLGDIRGAFTITQPLP